MVKVVILDNGGTRSMGIRDMLGNLLVIKTAMTRGVTLRVVSVMG